AAGAPCGRPTGLPLRSWLRCGASPWCAWPCDAGCLAVCCGVAPALLRWCVQFLAEFNNFQRHFSLCVVSLLMRTKCFEVNGLQPRQKWHVYACTNYAENAGARNQPTTRV